MKSRDERLTDRTCKLINEGKGIFLRKKEHARYVYVGQWTCIQGGPDNTHWTYWSRCAMEIGDLKWAFALAKLYGCKVVSRKLKPNKKK